MQLRSLIAGLGLLAGQAMAADATALKLYVFDCGIVNVSDISVFSPGVDVGKPKTLVDSCYLVVHPKGTLIWDTGFNDALNAQSDGVKPSPLFHIKMPKTLAGQFAQIGIEPKNVTYLGLSHMHFDHIGNVGLFPNSILLMQKEEYESAFGPDARKYNNDPATYPTLKANPVKQLSGDLDVFGDGSVTIKRMLGHTPGHQALFVKLPKTGNLLISGDLVHFTENWERKGVPSFNFDKEQSVKTMEAAAQFLKDNKATLWIQHDAAQNAGIKHAPAYYD
ncbi:N-acyl homoserine lactonase family protein [Massilia sp. TS11]|uniref:N-acyl homoserine lactonase family protein n=1 Tax=Massilia sp. TS11 TaxID=2908003 RepID=UPI001EDC14D2|nr:N-acyl homoserine lactonase family protein [Massilia sp. TS11]MCG2583496.1 N-acyl homoserine lactonase family protein [Massilia sp. TS11]